MDNFWYWEEALIQWPESTLQVDSLFRKEYIQVLRQADQGDYDSLIALHKKLAHL